MKAAENKRSVIVGIFVFLGIAIFVAGVFTLAGKQQKFKSSITVKAVFDDVAGLGVGNNVWFSGVKIGTVKRIDFYGESQVEIAMNIHDDIKKYIHKDAKARISSESLIGNKIIVIDGGSPKVPEVQDGDHLQTEAALDTDDLMATLQENNKNLVAITSDFKSLSAGIAKGEGTIGALLTDSTLEDDLRTMIASLQKVSDNTARASGALAKFSAKLNTEGGLANELLTDTIVFSSLKTSVSKLEKTTAAAAEMTDNFNQVSGKLNDNNNAIGALMNDQELAARLKNTMANVETSTQKLDENLEALQHNFLLRGYFRKKAKREAKAQADANAMEQKR